MPFETTTLIHNPQCSKSRRAKELLDDRGIPYQERRYLDDPLSAGELAELARRLGQPPRAWLRAQEAACAQAGLTAQSTGDEILAAMERFPILIERPIVVLRDSAFVARPPELIVDRLASPGES